MPKEVRVHEDLESFEPDTFQQDVQATTFLGDYDLPKPENKDCVIDGATVSQIRVEDKDRRSSIGPSCIGHSVSTQRSPNLRAPGQIWPSRLKTPSQIKPNVGAQYSWRSQIFTNKEPEHYEHSNALPKSNEILEHATVLDLAIPGASRSLNQVSGAHGSVKNIAQERSEGRSFTEQSVASLVESVSISSKSCGLKGAQKTSWVGKAFAQHTIQGLASCLQSVSISAKSPSSEGELMKKSRVCKEFPAQATQDTASCLQPVSICKKYPSLEGARMKTSRVGTEFAHQTTQGIASCPRPISISTVKTGWVGDSSTKPYIFMQAVRSNARKQRSRLHRKVLGEKIFNDKGVPSTWNMHRKKRSGNRNSSVAIRHDTTALQNHPHSSQNYSKSSSFNRLSRAKNRTGNSAQRDECDKCGKRFKRKFLTRYCTLDSETKSYHGDVCSTTFLKKMRLQRLPRVYTSAKPYECDLCKKEKICTKI